MYVSAISILLFRGRSTPAIRAISLPLPLLVPRILLADDPNHPGSPDHLAVLTDRFDAAANLHTRRLGRVCRTALKYTSISNPDQARPLRGRQNNRTTLADRHGVLEVRAPLPVQRHHRPAIGKGANFGVPSLIIGSIASEARREPETPPGRPQFGTCGSVGRPATPWPTRSHHPNPAASAVDWIACPMSPSLLPGHRLGDPRAAPLGDLSSRRAFSSIATPKVARNRRTSRPASPTSTLTRSPSLTTRVRSGSRGRPPRSPRCTNSRESRRALERGVAPRGSDEILDERSIAAVVVPAGCARAGPRKPPYDRPRARIASISAGVFRGSARSPSISRCTSSTSVPST